MEAAITVQIGNTTLTATTDADFPEAVAACLRALAAAVTELTTQAA